MPRARSSLSAARPRSSSPSAVNNVTSPARRFSSRAAMAPPPAACVQVSFVWMISPRRGTRSTRANSTTSTCPTTAHLTSSAVATLKSMMEAVTIPPFERFYEEHRDAVFRHLVRLLGRQRADDAFQETFLRALRGYADLEHGRHLKAWVFTIATRVAADEGRRPLAVDAELGAELGIDGERPAYAQLEHLAAEL